LDKRLGDAWAMSAPTAFFGRTYDEAFALLEEARDYVPHGQRIECRDVTTPVRARVALETTRMTSRLIHVMAWLLARKAVHAGEITAAEANQPPYSFERRELLASDDTSLVGAPLPPMLESLTERSQRLYVRVSRRDELARRDVGA
jgi:regulator of CtrA degradation